MSDILADNFFLEVMYFLEKVNQGRMNEQLIRHNREKQRHNKTIDKQVFNEIFPPTVSWL